MQSNAYHNSYSNGNVDLYKEVFKVLDQLGMSDLRITFQEHYIQDQTLSFVETEDELKQILREIGIPLGRCIPIMKSWSKRYSQKENTQQSKGMTADQSTQASVETADACVQTDDIFNSMVPANYHAAINNMTAEMQLNSQQEMLNHYHATMASAGFQMDDAHNITARDLTGALAVAAQVPVSYGPQQVDPYTAAQMWTTSIAHYPTDFAPGIYGPGAYMHPANAGVPAKVITTVTDNMLDNQASEVTEQSVSHLNHVERRIASPPVQTHEVAHHRPHPGTRDIVDEREDLAIEQSLKDFEDMERESQHSYASALNSDAASQDSQLSYGASSDQPSHKVTASHPGPAYSSHQRPQPSPPSVPSSTRPQAAPKTTSTQYREKAESSQFSKCDDIAVESGVLRKSSSLQNVGSQTLQAYLESVPETKEYKEGMACRNPKKGWKAVDGKHMVSGRKVAFKPMFWDNEGRMRHGVRVRGADKSEECWRHIEGKAPAQCTFAHSRLGDTLEFICVRCTCEKGINEWCMDKMKHKQYIFNLGPYRNLEGGVWKKSS